MILEIGAVKQKGFNRLYGSPFVVYQSMLWALESSINKKINVYEGHYFMLEA